MDNIVGHLVIVATFIMAVIGCVFFDGVAWFVCFLWAIVCLSVFKIAEPL